MRIWTLGLLAAGCTSDGPQAGAVLLDGRFEEWSDAPTIVDDPADAPASFLDLGAVQGLDDAEWLYLSIEVGHAVNPQSMPGTLELLLDTDDDAATGGPVRSMEGVDLIVQLSPTDDVSPAARGQGFALRSVGANGVKGPMVRYARGLLVAPSWAASRFEMRLSRGPAEGLAGLGRTPRLKAVYIENGRVEDETPVGSYGFRTLPATRVLEVGATERLTKPEGSLRVAQWNVSGVSFSRNAEGFARLLAAVDPDVALLDELPEGITAQAVADFLELEPLRSAGTWRFVLGQSGGRQRTLVAVRDREVRAAESMQWVRYPEGALEALRADTPPEFHPLLDLEAVRGISSTGAWVDVGEVDALFVPLDLQSAGWANSPQDRLRDLQASTIREHIQREVGASGAPVVIGGDLNLVGARRPLVTLAQGLDVDGSDLTPVDAERLGERSLATWRDPRTPFAPGRLDYLLVPNATSTVKSSFVFATEDLNAETLQRLGLEPGLSASLSDHLIMVADLEIRRP